jgi:hypothetical protein
MSAGAATPPGMGQIESRLDIGMCCASILDHSNFSYDTDTNTVRSVPAPRTALACP